MHIAIIGAGPAGSVAAILLARSGVGVTLIEQHRFPRDKVCGECLSALGIGVLNRLGLKLPGEPVELLRCILHAPDGSFAKVRLPRPMWGLSRVMLDTFLLEAARSCGVSIRQPARAENVSPLRVRNLESNQFETLEPDLILVADGKGPPTGDFGLKAHFKDVSAPLDAISLFGVDGHYGGIAPIEGGLWNIAFSVPGQRVTKHRGDLGQLFKSVVEESVPLRRQMRGATRAGKWLVSPLPRFGVARQWPANVIPIGNAAAALEPIGGEGMGLAMRSAELAAQWILAGARNVHELRRGYNKLWRIRRVACRAAALAVSSPRVACAIAPFVESSDDLLAGLALRAIGKF
jgi:flavin-dependent dehydrogenase